MPQVFHRHANLMLWLAALAILSALSTAAVAWRFAIARPAARGEPIMQPVPFSHQHHVGDEGFDCRYCHTAVETSAHAGLPPTETCMTCHSQLFSGEEMLQPVLHSLRSGEPLTWLRVHDLPDFVYFNHAVHVNNGIGCSSCHGRVDRMPQVWREQPLTMQWCLGCHRDPLPHLRPPERIYEMDWKPAADQRRQGRRLARSYGLGLEQLTDCSVCHR